MLERRNHSDGLVYYASPLLERVGIPHAFSTRLGGVSSAPFDSLNLGNPSGDTLQDADDLIQENIRRLQNAIGCANKTRMSVHQVHAGQVADARAGIAHTSSIKADAIITNDPTRVLSIRIADCAPVLISNQSGSIVAAVHAGWRGVIAGVVPNTIQKMQEFGCNPEQLIAAIGPCISENAFEVGLEVVEEFERAFGVNIVSRRLPDGKGRVDLRKGIQLQLLAAGIPVDRIDTTDRCTHRDKDEFFSHRRDNGVTGRLAALISLTSLA